MGTNIEHLWVAHNLDGAVPQLKKNTGQGSNFYWDGATIYSYGAHFPIAEIVPAKGKKPAFVFFTRETRSVTTAKHLRAVKWALRGRTGLEVYNLASVSPYGGTVPNATTERDYYTRASERAFQASTTAKSKAADYLASGLALIEEGNRLSKAFKLGWTLKAPNAKKMAELKAHALGERAKDLKARKEREAAQKIDRDTVLAYIHEARAAWVAGLPAPEKPLGVNTYRFGDLSRELPTLCRIEGNEVVTTRGARVPLEDAKKLASFVEARIGRPGVSWHGEAHAPFMVGAFKLERIEADGTVKIGCHIIQGAEVARMAELLKGV